MQVIFCEMKNYYGQGLTGEGSKAQALVYFPTVGKKHLMLEYAKLQIVG